MMRSVPFLLALLFATAAFAQSDTLPSAGSTAGVTILGTGRSIKPAELTPTGPRTPGSTQTPPLPTLHEFQPRVPQPRPASPFR